MESLRLLATNTWHRQASSFIYGKSPISSATSSQHYGGYGESFRYTKRPWSKMEIHGRRLGMSNQEAQESEAVGRMRVAQAETQEQQATTRLDQARTQVDQAATHTAQTLTQTEQANTRSEQSETKAKQSNTHNEQAETHTEQANVRTEQAETRTEQARIWKMEKALRASELRYRRLFEAAQDGILILEVVTGRITDVNPFLEKLLGFSHEEMVGKTVAELSPFKDFVSNQAMLELLQKDGYVRYEDLPLETRDGRHIAVEFVSNVYQAGDQKVIQCNIRDITARKKGQANASLLMAIVESSEDGIIGRDPQGIITSWNKGAEKLFGFTSAEMINESITKLIPEDRRDEERIILEKIGRGEIVRHFETVRQTKAGRMIDVSVTASPIMDASGKVLGVSKVARDITERRIADSKIQQLNAELEQRVAARTAELETFSYAVSHDLRAPVRAIGGFARMVQESYAAELPAEANRKLGRIHENAMKLGQLIDGLLTFSQLGNQPLAKRVVLPLSIVKRLLEELQTEQPGRNLTITLDDLPACLADPTLLQQVYANLLSNAFKYSRHKDLAVIEIGSQYEAGRCVYFVKDNGAGFEPEYAHKLFGVFQRLHQAEEFEGTGVGLAIVQRIIHRHGGKIWAESEVGKGARFFFTLGEGDQHD